jgi:polar amino acid transport system substrate-binding protein
MKKRALLGVAALLVIAALALFVAACGSSGSSSSASPAASSSGTTAGGITVTTDPSLKAMLPSSNQSSGQIRVASDIPYPPWELYDPATSKNPAGFDYDLSQMLGAKIGVKVSFNETPFDSIILSIKGGKNDMIMSDMYDNAEREKQGVSFVDYAGDGTGILTKKGNPDGLTGFASLAGKTVSCESGTTQQALLGTLNTQFQAAGQSQMTILALPNQPAALLAVTSGRAVGDLTDHSTAVYTANTTNNGKTFEVVTDPSAPEGSYPQLVGIGIVATNTQLVDTVQKALQALIDDGAYAQLIQKWSTKGYTLQGVTAAQVNGGPAYFSAQLAKASASPSP